MTLAQQILKEVNQLNSDQQQEVLGFARLLRLNGGIPGKKLLRFAGAISPADLKEMSQVIEDGCERVDPDAWYTAARHEYRHRDFR